MGEPEFTMGQMWDTSPGAWVARLPPTAPWSSATVSTATANEVCIEFTEDSSASVLDADDKPTIELTLRQQVVWRREDGEWSQVEGVELEVRRTVDGVVVAPDGDPVGSDGLPRCSVTTLVTTWHSASVTTIRCGVRRSGNRRGVRKCDTKVDF